MRTFVRIVMIAFALALFQVGIAAVVIWSMIGAQEWKVYAVATVFAVVMNVVHLAGT